MSYKVLLFGENLSVVVSDCVPHYIPYILRGTAVYDGDTFRPIENAERSLKEQFHAEARELMEKAKDLWVPPPKPEEVPAPQSPAGGSLSALEKLIADSVSGIAAGQIVENAKLAVDDYIRTNYGALPRTIEIKSAKGVNQVSGVTHSQFETVLSLVGARIPVFLTGPAGSGKNVLCQQIADGLGLEFFFSNAITQEYKLTGFTDAMGKYQETQFYQAFTNGGLFMLDEIDASTPEVLVILNAAIANGYFDFPCGKKSAHDDFRLIAAGNTYGTGADLEYTGRNQLDAASLDRFAVIEIDYEKDIELAIAQNDKELVEFIHRLREEIKKAGIKFVVSYRATQRLATLKGVLSNAQAVKLTVIKGLDREDLRMIAKQLGDLSGNAYGQAFIDVTLNDRG